uniref:Uncharacterized protein n=1 Tax=Romanomermis culicivorax TaxID=13658 RepID=A0A915J396_ROMCU
MASPFIAHLNLAEQHRPFETAGFCFDDVLVVNNSSGHISEIPLEPLVREDRDERRSGLSTMSGV